MKFTRPLSFRCAKSLYSRESGFTLIELMVVILIIGILAGIAWPAFLTQAAKAKQAKAITAIGAINRAQQAYRMENNAFANSLDNLGVEVTNSQEYSYNIDSNQVSYTLSKATPQDQLVRGYMGVAYSYYNGSDVVASALLCKGEPGAVPSPTPLVDGQGQISFVGCSQP